MITYHNKRPGRPKGKTPPVSSASRASKFRQTQKETGGATVRVNFDATELRQIEEFKNHLSLPARTSRAEIIKSMTCLLSGGVYFTNGHQVSASIEIVERDEFPTWLADIYIVP